MARRSVKRFRLQELFDSVSQFMDMTTIEKVWSWGFDTYTDCWQANPTVEWICISDESQINIDGGSRANVNVSSFKQQ